jgi:hypothetical protein
VRIEEPDEHREADGKTDDAQHQVGEDAPTLEGELETLHRELLDLEDHPDEGGNHLRRTARALCRTMKSAWKAPLPSASC